MPKRGVGQMTIQIPVENKGIPRSKWTLSQQRIDNNIEDLGCSRL